MIDELIVQIKQSEVRAEEIIRGSVVKSKEIIAAAKIEAEKITADTAAELRLINGETVMQGEIKADERYAEIIAEADRAAESLKAIGAKNKKEAVAMIVDKVLG